MTKLLLVEDNEMNRDMLSRRLERKGYQVVCAENVETAVEQLLSGDIGLVLLDCVLPGGSMWQAYSHVGLRLT